MASPLITYYPYQKAWIKDKSRFKIGMFSRQTGKTFSTCGEIVEECIKAEIAGKRVRWIILSRGERQAKEAVDEAIKPLCKAFYAIYEGLSKSKGPQYYEDQYTSETGATYKTQEVIFPSGSRITALPANPDTARGYSANVFLDEFAFHKDSRDIWAALFPVISKDGLKLRITSTPNGKSNKFYELWTARDTTWSKHEVDIHKAVAQGLPRDPVMLKAGLADEDIWDQEYELKFLDAASAWLPYDLIMGCEHKDAGRPELYQGGPVYIGNDIASRGGDLWVAWVWEQVGDVLWCREISTLKRAKFAMHDTELDRLEQKYRMLRLAMDQTGMGEKPVEDAEERYGKHRVEGVVFNASNKLTIATVAKQAFEDKRVRIPAGDTILRADLHKVQKVIGATGAPRLVADRDGEGHADRAWACWLGIAAADMGADDFLYQSFSMKGL